MRSKSINNNKKVRIISESEGPNKVESSSDGSSSRLVIRLNKPQRKRKLSEVEGTLVSRVLKHVKVTDQSTLELPETDQAIEDSHSRAVCLQVRTLSVELYSKHLRWNKREKPYPSLARVVALRVP